MPTKPGAIVEISTKKGFAYAQCTHKRADWGALLRVFEGFHASRPPSFDEIVRGPVLFQVFFPLDAALRQQIVRVVAREPVPEEASDFPIFRGGVADEHGNVAVWWLWDGEQEWPLDGPLTDEQRRFPIRASWNDTLLIERIESGWRAEDHG